MNAEWLGVRRVRRLPARGRVGDHVAKPNGMMFVWSSVFGCWVQAWPNPAGQDVATFNAWREGRKRR